MGPISGQGLVGAVIVLVGVVLLAETTGLYDTGRLWRFLPSLFVLVGIYAMVTSRFRNLTGPLVLIVFAGAVQLVTLDLIAGEDVLSLWPILLIVAGLSILAGQFRSTAHAVSGTEVDAFALLGGNEQRATSETFTGGTLTALFGGVELDLRETTVEDRPARIDATALFGGVEVVVPRDWNVQMDILPILGGAEDERPRRETAATHDEIDLVVTGFVAFGGVTISD